MSATVHACGTEGCNLRKGWAEPPAVISVREAGRCEVVTICPCLLCDGHVSAGEVSVVDERLRPCHLRCFVEAVSEGDAIMDRVRGGLR